MTTYLFNAGHLEQNGIKKTLNELNPGLLNIMKEFKILLKTLNPFNLRDSKLLKNTLFFALGDASKMFKTINLTKKETVNQETSQPFKKRKEKLFC